MLKKVIPFFLGVFFNLIFENFELSAIRKTEGERVEAQRTSAEEGSQHVFQGKEHSFSVLSFVFGHNKRLINKNLGGTVRNKLSESLQQTD